MKIFVQTILILLGCNVWIKFVIKRLRELTTDRAIIAYLYCMMSPMISLGLCFGSAGVVNACEYLITGQIT